jgi:ADP-ribosylglycohydrolase
MLLPWWVKHDPIIITNQALAMPSLPDDYLERVYAGVLGKLIGVYLGRPFEGWTHQRIMKELGPIRYYVHQRLNSPLVVTDDDVSGTFIFVQALNEHGVSSELSSEAIGKTWLNNVIEHRAIFWWGGNGISTEHTAWLNLKRGIPAPLSGAMETNGQAVAEQIGAQIFIDGWAMVAPGNPPLAAKLAAVAGSVSHDGESVHAAKLLAAMEAEAFLSKDVDHLLDVGLSFVPSNCLIARLISDIRGWVKSDRDWEKTRQRIEDVYGYDKYPGNCHVIPNHGLIIMALLYAGDDFHKAMYIINTCGWDTDCNSGNLGCLVAIMHGITAFDGGPDWRGPLADRALISSADAGYSINNAARIAYDLANLGRKLAGEAPLIIPKNGARFHFTLPGSVQGFQASHQSLSPHLVKIEQAVDHAKGAGLAIRLHGLTNVEEPVEVLTQTFTSPEIINMETYDMLASPLIEPGQRVYAVVQAEGTNTSAVDARLRLKVYGEDDRLDTFDGPSITLNPGEKKTIDWIIPDNMDSQPIQQIGLALSVPQGRLDGTVWLDSLDWSGTPRLTLKRPDNKGKGDFWRRAWVNGVSIFQKHMKASFYIAQNSGEGILIHGTRDWKDYSVLAHQLKVHLGAPAGVAVRVQGLNRYYALVFVRGNRVALVKARDEKRTELASAAFEWKLDVAYSVSLTVEGKVIKGIVGDGPALQATDADYLDGGIGLVVADGSVSVDRFEVAPLE